MSRGPPVTSRLYAGALSLHNIFDCTCPDSIGAAMTFKTNLLQALTWWSGQTLNTRLWTWRYGERVGSDEFGNIYYRKPGIDPTLLFERRWVIYAGESEASLTPPGWYGWLHHTVDTPPTEETYVPREWQKPYLPNMTGTPDAYRPPGSTLNAGKRPRAGGDYGAWTPG